MKKKSRIKKAGAAGSTASDKLFKVVIILLAVILVFMVSITIAKIKTGFSDYTSTPNDLLRTIKNGYYSDAVSEMYDNIALGETVEKDADYAVPYALLEYFEAESKYTGYIRAAELTSDTAENAELMAKADEYKADMEAAISGMGELAFMTDEIDGYFG